MSEVSIDLSEIQRPIVRRLESDLVRAQGLPEGLRPVFDALGEGVRAAWQSGGRATVSLNLTAIGEADLWALARRSLSIRDTFARGEWPQIAELFNSVLLAVRDEQLLRALGKQRRRRTRRLGGKKAAAEAQADTNWTAEPPKG